MKSFCTPVIVNNTGYATYDPFHYIPPRNAPQLMTAPTYLLLSNYISFLQRLALYYKYSRHVCPSLCHTGTRPLKIGVVT